MRTISHEVLEAARVRAQLSVEQLWLRYMALTGLADQIEVEAYLHGLMPLDADQRDKLAHAINERLDELHQAARVPYAMPTYPAPREEPQAVVEELLDAVRRAAGHHRGRSGGGRVDSTGDQSADGEGEGRRQAGDPAEEMLAGLLSAARLSVPDDLAVLLADRVRALGAQDVTIYLVDHEQYLLTPLPQHDLGDRQPLSIEGTLAGRCFRRLDLQRSDGGRRMWVPLLDGLERLGVLQFEFASGDDAAPDEQLNAFAAVVAEVVMVKGAYGDLFARVRSRQPMSLAAEIAWNLLPPLTFGTDRLVISSVLAPAYDVGGDCFDYAVDATTARFALFDAMGHGLPASWLATVAIAAYRSARRRALQLPDTVDAIDAALGDTFGAGQFVTGAVAELDLASGQLRYINAGHPAPLLLRGGHVVKTLQADPALPLGLRWALGHSTGTTVPVGEESLQPGDRLLLYTDGVTEARDADGDLFGVNRLADFVTRQESAGQPAPETMRRLMHTLLAYQAGDLRDDATTMLVEWQGGGAERITPADNNR